MRRKPSRRGALERGIDARMGDAAVADLGPAEAHALPQHARDLGDVAVGVGVGGAAADHHEQGLLPAARRRLPRASAASIRSRAAREQLRVDAELAAELDPQAVLGGIGVEHRGHVVLDVAGGEQHARHREHVIDAAGAQPRPAPRAASAGRIRESRSRPGSAAGGRRGRGPGARTPRPHRRRASRGRTP